MVMIVLRQTKHTAVSFRICTCCILYTAYNTLPTHASQLGGPWTTNPHEAKKTVLDNAVTYHFVFESVVSLSTDYHQILKNEMTVDQRTPGPSSVKDGQVASRQCPATESRRALFAKPPGK